MYSEENKAKLIKIINKASDLPSLPHIATNALSLMNNPRTSMKDLGNVISSDQAITSKLLRMVNSAYYGFPRKISTISQALVVIGVEGLRSLIMGLSLQPMFNSKLGKQLWIHSINTAAASKVLTQKYGNVHPEESFVVGLIHDIGRLVLAEHFTEELEFYELIRYENSETYKTEKEIFGMDHTEIGSKVATNWNLPPKMIESIKYHHTPNMVAQNQVCLIVYLADGIASYIEALDNIQFEGQEVNLEDFIKPIYMEKLKLKEIPEQMIDDIKSKAKDLIDVFESN